MQICWYSYFGWQWPEYKLSDEVEVDADWRQCHWLVTIDQFGYEG